MKNKRYRPLTDKMFYLIWMPTGIFVLGATLLATPEPLALYIMLGVDVFTCYFLISSLVGYVELREASLFVRFGFIIKREIPYSKIRSVSKERKIISESMLSLKNALEHLTIRYNRFDVICVSVKDNNDLMREIEERRSRPLPSEL